MVVNIDAGDFGQHGPARTGRSLRHAAWPGASPASQCLTIGLVNNMAGAAFQATEHQFVSLLNAASDGIPIHVSFYTLPGLTQTESGRQRFASHYASVASLLDTALDGLIVTGREPKTADLRDEPYWDNFTQLLEWARSNTYSSIWSCLAAHAAILHMDGVGRRKSKEKNFGVFQCAQAGKRPLMQGLPPRFPVPHSRWNGVAEEDLTGSGYRILSRIAGNGVDSFVKEDRSLLVFFQGHLEYDSDTLLREYRRDVGRYVRGETDVYPLLPHGYLDRKTESALTMMRAKVVARRDGESLAAVAASLEKTRVANTWERSAARIYRNWLESISAHKSEHKGKLYGIPASTMSGSIFPLALRTIAPEQKPDGD